MNSKNQACEFKMAAKVNEDNNENNNNEEDDIIEEEEDDDVLNDDVLNDDELNNDVLNNDAEDFLMFLNQPVTQENISKLTELSYVKEFDEVWSRERLHLHASFSTSRRKFIGKRGDFYQNLTLLYPAPTNESTFYIRFTSNGMKNILIRHCEFDIQLCYIVNYKKATIL